MQAAIIDSTSQRLWHGAIRVLRERIFECGTLQKAYRKTGDCGISWIPAALSGFPVNYLNLLPSNPEES
jgi:hypothetical protein